jgi:ATP-dependent RNA helicase RhlE
MLRDPAFARVLVFTRTKHGADRVVRHLAATGIEAAAIHGNKSQPQRERALAGFRDGQPRVLIATDIAARGIDVDGVSHVINFELPNVPEDYVHRIGRTARAGAAGIALALCSDEERPYLRDIEKLTRHSLRRVPLPAAMSASHPGPQAPFEPPVAANPSRDGRLPLRQAVPSGGTGAPQPSRARDADFRRSEPTATGSLPAFLTSAAKPGFTSRRGPSRGRPHRVRLG